MGYLEAKRQDYAVMFEIARFGAAYNTYSKDQAKALSRAKNPYTDKKPKGKPLTMNQVGGFLSALARTN